MGPLELLQTAAPRGYCEEIAQFSDGRIPGARAVHGGAVADAAEARALLAPLERGCHRFLEDSCQCCSMEADAVSASDVATRSLCGGAGDGRGVDALHGGAPGAELVRLHASLLGAILRLRGADDTACAAEVEGLLPQALRSFCSWLVFVTQRDEASDGICAASSHSAQQGLIMDQLDRGEVHVLKPLLSALQEFVQSGALTAFGTAMWMVASAPRSHTDLSPQQRTDAAEGTKFVLLHLGQLLREWMITCLSAEDIDSEVMRMIGAASGELSNDALTTFLRCRLIHGNNCVLKELEQALVECWASQVSAVEAPPPLPGVALLSERHIYSWVQTRQAEWQDMLRRTLAIEDWDRIAQLAVEQTPSGRYDEIEQPPVAPSVRSPSVSDFAFTSGMSESTAVVCVWIPR